MKVQHARSRCFLEPNMNACLCGSVTAKCDDTPQLPEKDIVKGRDLQSPLPGTLATCPFGFLPQLARHCMKSFGQYSIMLCARAGSNTEFLHSGFRFLHPSRPRPFWQRPPCTKYASLAGSGHGCGSSRIQRYNIPCSCGSNECLTQLCDWEFGQE